MSSTEQGTFFSPSIAPNNGTIRNVTALRGHRGEVREQCRQVRGATVYSAGATTRRTWARTDAAARPCLLSPPSASLRRKLPALVKDTGPPSSAATCRIGKSLFGRYLDDLLPCLDAQTTRRSHMELLQCCGGAKSGRRF